MVNHFANPKKHRKVEKPNLNITATTNGNSIIILDDKFGHLAQENAHRRNLFINTNINTETVSEESCKRGPTQRFQRFYSRVCKMCQIAA